MEEKLLTNFPKQLHLHLEFFLLFFPLRLLDSSIVCDTFVVIYTIYSCIAVLLHVKLSTIDLSVCPFLRSLEINGRWTAQAKWCNFSVSASWSLLGSMRATLATGRAFQPGSCIDWPDQYRLSAVRKSPPISLPGWSSGWSTVDTASPRR